MKTILLVFEEPAPSTDIVKITTTINKIGYSVRLQLPDIDVPKPAPEFPELENKRAYQREWLRKKKLKQAQDKSPIEEKKKDLYDTVRRLDAAHKKADRLDKEIPGISSVNSGVNEKIEEFKKQQKGVI